MAVKELPVHIDGHAIVAARGDTAKARHRLCQVAVDYTNGDIDHDADMALSCAAEDYADALAYEGEVIEAYNRGR